MLDVDAFMSDGYFKVEGAAPKEMEKVKKALLEE